LQLAEILGAILSISEGIAECNSVILDVYIKFVDIALVIKLLISFTCNLLIIFKVKYSKLISPFKISFIIVIYVVLSISNKDINITQKSLY
jgi:hypothetical protein